MLSRKRLNGLSKSILIFPIQPTVWCCIFGYGSLVPRHGSKQSLSRGCVFICHGDHELETCLQCRCGVVKLLLCKATTVLGRGRSHTCTDALSRRMVLVNNYGRWGLVKQPWPLLLGLFWAILETLSLCIRGLLVKTYPSQGRSFRHSFLAQCPAQSLNGIY